MVVSEIAAARIPSGEYAHQLTNSDAVELRYLVVSTMQYPDLSEYPDWTKAGAYSSPAVGPNAAFRALYVRNRNVNYYEGETGKLERILNTARRS